MNNYRIAIVNSSSFGHIFPEHIERLEEIGEVERIDVESDIDGKALAEVLAPFNIVISSVTPFFTREFFDNKKDLLLISRHGIGYNNVDLEAAKECGTVVSIVSPLVERGAVAEQNITNLLTVMRRVTESSKAVKSDHWEDRASYVGRTLFNKTLGVIGIGNTGSCVAEIARYGYKCDVLAYDPYKSQTYIESFGAHKVDFETLLKQSDVICLCANLTEENYHMISTEQINLMKDHVYLSNSARGALLDEEAIVEGLASGKIAGLGTDVLEVEPGRGNHPYLQFDNVVMTPHTGAYTLECLEGMGLKCLEDVERIVNGKVPHTAVQTAMK